MIAHLRGRLVLREPGAVVIDVGGIGYLVHVTATDRLPPPGEPVEVFTSMQVREESIALYGFTERGSLALFETLLSSSGVGPKLALAALATHRPAVLAAAIAEGDVTTLTAIPGVGKKVAERMVLELKDKVRSEVVDRAGVSSVSGVAAKSSTTGEVREALLGLGYAAPEIQAALTEVAPDDDATTETVLRQALQVLGAGMLDGSRS